MTSSDQRVRVVVADDHPLYREGVVRALLATGQIEVLAEAEDGRQALKQIEEHEPQVAVLDYKLPELDGLQVTHAVIRDGHATRILMQVRTAKLRPGGIGSEPLSKSET